jgi:hypothetical protein
LRADPFQIGDVLKNSKRFVVPIYQRTYAWKIKPHLESFFDQVEAKAAERLNGNGHFPHYMGAVLVIPRGAYSFGRMEVLDVVDGQQRLTTFQIFLAALRDLARTLGQSQTADLLGSLLLNPEGPQLHERIERYKLYPTAYDRKLYCDLIDLDWDGLRKKYPDAFLYPKQLTSSFASSATNSILPVAMISLSFLRKWFFCSSSSAIPGRVKDTNPGFWRKWFKPNIWIRLTQPSP